MTRSQFTISEINRMDQAAFVGAFGFVFEDSPWIAAQAWSCRPFTDPAHLHQALCAVMYHAPLAQQLALIQAHPDLVGRAARAGTLTPESTQEQAAAGLDALSPAEIDAFSRFNAAYWEKFGFPFVICARENKKDAILAGFAARLRNSREAEIGTALGEIARIAYLRLQDVVRPRHQN